VENPQFSTAIGLVKFAQVMHTDRPARGFGRIFGRIFSGKRWRGSAQTTTLNDAVVIL